MHPILFQIGDFFVGTYGLLIVLALAAAVWVSKSLGERRGIPAEFFFDMAFIALFSGFLGARLLFIIVNFSEFLAAPGAMLLSRSGFVFLGGFLAAIPSVIILIYRRGMPIWEVADCAAPALAIGHSIGRIGCYLAGCCYGQVCSPESFFATRFPRVFDKSGQENFSFAFSDHLNRGLVEATDHFSAPVIPSQLLESAANLLIFAALLALWRWRRFSGQIFACYLGCYGAVRFGLEFLRGDSARGFLLGASTSQLISMATFAAGGILWGILRHRGVQAPPPPAPGPDPTPSATGAPAPAQTAAREKTPAIPRRKKRGK